MVSRLSRRPRRLHAGVRSGWASGEHRRERWGGGGGQSVSLDSGFGGPDGSEEAHMDGLSRLRIYPCWDSRTAIGVAGIAGLFKDCGRAVATMTPETSDLKKAYP